MTRTARPALHALAAIALWGTLAWLSLELAHVPPFLLVGTALAIGSLASLGRLRDWRAGPRLLALGVYGLFGFHFLLFMALRLAPPVEANLVNYLWPLLIVVLAPLVLPGYRLAARHVIAALMGLAGAALLVTGGGKVAFDAAHAPGYALALGSAFVWATYSLGTKRIGAFPTATVGLFAAVSAALALALHALLEPAYAFTAGDLPWLVLMGAGPMGAAFFLWDAALKQGDPRTIGTLAYLTPLLSTLVLAASGAGAITFASLVAMALIVGGAALAARAS
ncbi:MAG: DMT family transporter [Myxococcota bacterium]|jgi:drug/metabolite transporter (DMT)-like permease|nr:DMT family transporter [Myxococcota bacterium]